MNIVLWLLDAALCLSLIWLACVALFTADLFKATVLFIVFGLILALTWARLDAPDIALAEAAIGAGLTGAFFLSTLAALAEPAKGPASPPKNAQP
jgi:energy-converting hydrogenase B subunit D